jgi:hypothetical protein
MAYSFKKENHKKLFGFTENVFDLNLIFLLHNTEK